ncbi:hypothetical protein BE18_02980 [Sorangium cellulosum]|uniref:Uncharacterized protein n=1 Tax=Sorangium cellulosum TaxID=56 RepID=A0A150RLS0_SORCE|nr:hypothetical protein BE18_02980 [Sorangium cellulosum]
MGQTVAHIGFFPALVLSKHMSHFCICWISILMIGTPNGHASSQFPHEMHRGLRLECTIPFSSTLMASAGQTDAHVGSAQCMQTIGAVWSDTPGATRSTCTIGSPRCVWHSEHAAAHAWQPMHR